MVDLTADNSATSDRQMANYQVPIASTQIGNWRSAIGNLLSRVYRSTALQARAEFQSRAGWKQSLHRQKRNQLCQRRLPELLLASSFQFHWGHPSHARPRPCKFRAADP